VSNPAERGSQYRPEIDGLRAIAVVAVILFHAGVGVVSGGYVGVDVFFVISGYLITSIILADLARERFTFGGFYERRVRRIFPALFLVTAVTSILSWFLLLPQEMRDYGQSVVATMLSAANVFFYLKSDYFAPDVDLFPMIHMWSLAVEEQFYIVFPFVLLTIVRTGRSRWLPTALVLTIFASLATSVWLQQWDASADFFLPFSRAWELALGALVAVRAGPVRRFFADRRMWARLAEFTGIALIAGSILLMDRTTPFPGWFALPPVIGTALIIAASSADTPVGRMLSLRPVVGIGLLSYSAYLWHQPLFALARSYHGFPLHWGVFAALIGLTFVLSFLSWKYVEQPFRSRAFLTRRVLFGGSAALASLLIALGLLAHLSHGFPGRFSDRSVAIARTMELSPQRPCHTDGRNYRKPADACTYGGPETTWAVLGDSHGIEIGYALSEWLAKRGQGVLHLTFSACPPALTYDPRNPGCREWTEEAIRRIETDPKISNVLVAYRNGLHLVGDQHADAATRARLQANGPQYHNDFDRLIARLAKAGKQVTVLGPVPELPVSAEWLVFRDEGARQPLGAYLQRQGAILEWLRGLQRSGRIRLIEPANALCDETGCRAVIDGRAMYFDDNHLSMSGARRVLQRALEDGAIE
jgi:peptidoglycan/LPS O-acetylase OafA/YrhL